MSLPASSSPPFPSHMWRRGAAVSWRASSGRLDFVTFMCPCDSEHMGSFIACVCCRRFSKPAAGVGVRADQTLQVEEEKGCVVRHQLRENTGRREVEFSFCVFACQGFVFHSVHLKFSAATLVCGYPSTPLWWLGNFGVCESYEEEKWSGFQDLRRVHWP